jgi:hypothetical protein
MSVPRSHWITSDHSLIARQQCVTEEIGERQHAKSGTGPAKQIAASDGWGQAT